jgi:hypothetical protein
MAETFQENVLVTDVDGEQRPFARLAVRDAMNRLERFHRDGTAHGVSEAPDGEVRVRMGGDRGGIERVVSESALRRAWAAVRASAG